MKNKYIAIIAARGGSKGVPGKNLKEIGGKPLIAHSIKQAYTAGFFKHVFVNTDDKTIAEEAVKYGAEIPFMRPEHLATDTATTLDTLLHAIKEYEKICDFQSVFLLQPTSPFRRDKDFKSVLDVMEKGAEAATTYSPAQEHPSRMKIIRNNRVHDIVKEPKSLRRQETSCVVVRNGSIYAFRKNLPYEAGTLIPPSHEPVMTDNFSAVNIDTPFDLLVAKLLWENAWHKTTF